MSNMTFKEKAEYVWDYYKLHILLSVIIVCLLSWAIDHFFVNPPNEIFVSTGFYDVYIGEEVKEKYDKLINDTLQTNNKGFESSSNLFYVSNSDETTAGIIKQKFFTLLAIHELDLVIIKEEDFDKLETAEAFLPGLINISGNVALENLGVDTNGLAIAVVKNSKRPQNVEYVLELLGAKGN